MHQNASRLVPFVVSALLAAAGRPAFVQGAPAYETPPVLKASDLVDETLLSGPHHRVDEEARNDGFMNHFTIRTDFGDFSAQSEELLEIRIREVGALAKLAEISKTDAFASALKRSVAEPVTAVQHVVADPVGTIQGVPAGLNRKFKGLYYKAKKTGHKVQEEVQEEFEDDEPSAAEGKKTETAEAGAEQSSATDKTVDTVKNYAGWNSAKRQLAQSVQVDPYSANPVLQAELDRLAGAAFTGGLTFKLAGPSVSGLSVVEDVNSMVYETPPEELERLNDEALKDFGIDSATRFAFFDNARFTVSLETRLVEALKRISPVEGRGALVEIAATVETDLEARFFCGAADLLAAYHTGVGPLRELVVADNDEVGRLLAAVAEDGTLVVAVPVDYLIWQAGMEGGGPLSAYAKRELWVTGRVSPRAKQELAARGWSVLEEVEFGS